MTQERPLARRCLPAHSPCPLGLPPPHAALALGAAATTALTQRSHAPRSPPARCTRCAGCTAGRPLAAPAGAQRGTPAPCWRCPCHPAPRRLQLQHGQLRRQPALAVEQQKQGRAPFGVQPPGLKRAGLLLRPRRQAVGSTEAQHITLAGITPSHWAALPSARWPSPDQPCKSPTVQAARAASGEAPGHSMVLACSPHRPAPATHS